MTRIIGVRFKEGGKIYNFDPLDFEINKGDHVIVETARGLEYGEVLLQATEVRDNEIVAPLKNVVRIATSQDAQQAEINRKKEKDAFRICNEKIAKHGLEMKLIEVEYTFDANKILFYFTSGGRVDFRELVKDLAAIFKTRIELRQIGVRDEAKLLGGYGICGRCLCCASHLGDFLPVSIKMAKEQSLSLNPTKISGSCGRLMCCLKYEQENYEELIKITPREGAIVKTPDGKGVVISSQFLRGIVKVKLDNDDENIMKEFRVHDIKILKNVRIKEDKNVEAELKNLE